MVRKTSVRELHIHTSELVREAEQGGVIVLERRGEPVAELRRVTAAPGISPDEKKRIFDEMEEFWASMPQSDDITQMIEADRDR